MRCRVQVPRWILALVLALTCFGRTGLAMTPDGLALLEFRNGLTTISPVLESWNASDPSPCSWGGINCTGSGHVWNIQIPYQVPRLEGSLSPSLGRLKSLEVLWLDGNLLSGSIPPEIGNLSSLKVLSLSFQNFSGEVPPELYNCRNLTQLWLYTNDFTGNITSVLEELSKLPAIQQIGLDGNAFTGTLPPSIGNATTLTYLSLGISGPSAADGNYGQRGGGFGGQIPKELVNLKNLTLLWLGGNNFTGEIPSWLGKLSLLNDIDLAQNHFTGQLPPELGNLNSLQSLKLSWNKLEGTIPSSLSKLTNLSSFYLDYNNFTGEIPHWLGNMTGLKTQLIFDGNELIGTIPSSLGNLVNLPKLELANNSLTGPIPDSFASLISVIFLELSYNGLTGPIPANFSKIATSLEKLYLHNNSLSGPIPQDFGRFMPNLTQFVLSNNYFNGTLPDGLCQGGNLQWLQVDGNNLDGAIPPSLGGCNSLLQVRVSGNQFTSIPPNFGSNTSLQHLDVSRNQLTGPLPAGLGTNSSISLLDLSENRLTGDISVLDFSQLAQNLSILNLARNRFIGEIPAAMALCRSLFSVDLSYNSFTGAIPVALANLSSLQQLNLQGNNITALDPSIYSSLGTTLRTLNLAENPWNAPIAAEIGSLRVLQVLNLSYGGHTGPIPSALEQLTQLEVLDLSHNSLTGEVPSALGELMTSLVSVDVSFNRLTGSLPPAWVKFFLADPAAFRGNPGLCLHYDANNECVSSPSAGAGGRVKLSARVILGVVLGAAVALALVVLVAHRFRRRWLAKRRKAAKKKDFGNLTHESWALTFDDIMSATKHLSDEFIIGRGAHGVVYKLKWASDTYPSIAVKKIEFEDPEPTVLHKSFWAEVETVGQAKHRNLVRLLGYMKRDKVGLLLYDYVSNGDLHSALHTVKAGGGLHLTWKARLRIAQGIARGLAYLHHDSDSPIVHRDIKSRNVLLDDGLEAHISDFGLAKVLSTQPGSKPWQTTQNMVGTHGYMAPELGYSMVVAPQVDVYSYGVVLLELLTGKEPILGDDGDGKALHVAEWVNESVQLNMGRMSESVLDPSLLDPKDVASTSEMLCVQWIALLCTRENPADRPTMRDVENMFTTLASQSTEKSKGEEDAKNIWEEILNKSWKGTWKENRVKDESNNGQQGVRCNDGSGDGNKLNGNISVSSDEHEKSSGNHSERWSGWSESTYRGREEQWDLQTESSQA